MKSFLKKTSIFLLIGLIPVFILFVVYLIYDPFYVLKEYDNYSGSYIGLNRDFVSTENYLNKSKKYNYNSFIFGSSRTMGFNVSSWEKYLKPNDKVFKFDASGESIYGMYIKLKLIDERNDKIDNAFLLFCHDATFKINHENEGHIFVKHPLTSDRNKLSFHFEFFKTFLSGKFLFNFISFKMLGTYKPYMHGYIMKEKVIYNDVNNEIINLELENEINKNSINYYKKIESQFKKINNETIDTTIQIKEQQLYYLQEIKKIFDKHKTNYKIVISPTYDQIKYSLKDQEIMKSIFGQNIYDFSGKNRFTENYINYYEPKHFRTNVGDSILKLIY